jgi:iron complex outermembrane receptor protein
MIGNPYKWERHDRISASAFYTGFDQHRTLIGAGYVKKDLYKVFESKNFQPGVFPFAPIGSGSIADITDVSDTAPFQQPHKRTTRFFFVQDEWNLTQDWTLTAGLRRDNYSDFGGTTNPRLAIVWDADYDLTAKLMYGTAFRAPSFVELYNINNPVLIGTPGLVPEKMKTGEAALTWQATARLQLGANIFRYQMSDIIQVVGTTFQNTGKQTGMGMELEAIWDATQDVRLAANFSHQRSVDEATQQDAGLAPHAHGYLRADWRASPEWAVNTQINAVGTRQRAPGDTRAALGGYNTVDLTLHSDKGIKAWDFAVSVRNLFNADAREPSPFGIPFISIPNDFPLAGRSFYLQAGFKL